LFFVVVVIGKLGLFHKFLLRDSCGIRRHAGGNNSTRSANETCAGGSAVAAHKPVIVADWRMLFAEYPIVGKKFQMIDTFVYAAKTGEQKSCGSS
jgi:hypothetical protein